MAGQRDSLLVKMAAVATIFGVLFSVFVYFFPAQQAAPEAPDDPFAYTPASSTAPAQPAPAPAQPAPAPSSPSVASSDASGQQVVTINGQQITITQSSRQTTQPELTDEQRATARIARVFAIIFLAASLGVILFVSWWGFLSRSARQQITAEQKGLWYIVVGMILLITGLLMLTITHLSWYTLTDQGLTHSEHQAPADADVSTA